jgi:phenylalanyl-tRNA synthetase beta chain
MKVTYNWLKDFLNLKISPQELAEKLTMAGLEVVSLEEKGGDFVLEIEITSNRPDWLSILGIAREVSAITGLPFKVTHPQEPKIKAQQSFPMVISVADKKDCPFYSARIIYDVKVGPSPEWLKKRLELLGCRSINNIVDITNYVLFELGQPLHAFDLDTLNQEELNVRRAKLNEQITTLDGESRLLSPEILVIADKFRPVAIAGVMGGKTTEVTFKTRNILLESAIFNPVLVRRGRQKLGLQSESAYRFERGVDPEGVKIAALVAQELIVKLAAGTPYAYKSSGTLKITNPIINLDAAYVNKVLGLTLPVAKIKQILSKLGLQVKAKTKNILVVKVPGFRQDLKLPIDLVEEIARIYGYAKIPQTLPAVKLGQSILDNREIIAGIKNILRSLGLHEAITYSLINRNLLNKAGIDSGIQLVEIANSLSQDQDILRPTLLPSLIRCLAYNLDQQQEEVCIFEAAHVFSAGVNSVQEEPALGIALCGVSGQVTILHLKGVLENLFNKLGIKDFDFIREDDNKINIVIGDKHLGFMLDLSQQILDGFDIKNRQVVLAQINLEKLFGQINLSRKFTGIPKYPAITRDISFLIKDDLSVKDLLLAIEATGAPLLRQAKVVDYYQGKQIPAGFKGLTISCLYRVEDRTLTEEEVASRHQAICSLLQERFGIKLR